MENKAAWRHRKQGQLDAASLSSNNACQLGKWLQGEGKTKFGKLAGYAPCVTAHTDFHKAAGGVATAINAGKYPEAKALMGANSAFATASNAVGVAIMRLKKEANL